MRLFELQNEEYAEAERYWLDDEEDDEQLVCYLDAHLIGDECGCGGEGANGIYCDCHEAGTVP